MSLHFKVSHEIGTVPLGRAWEAREIDSGEDLLLKRIPLEAIGWGKNGWASMLDELRRLPSLHHPAVAPLLEAREDGEDFLSIGINPEGRSLKELAREGGGLTRSQLKRWILPVLEALAVAHDRGIIHRHVHESLITVDQDGQPSIQGFGLSLAGNIETEDIPPELLSGASATPASDQFLSGAMISRLLRPELRQPALVAVIEKSRNRIPEKRFGEMLEMMDAFKAALDQLKTEERLGPATSSETPPVGKAQEFVRKEAVAPSKAPSAPLLSSTPGPDAEAAAPPAPFQDLHKAPAGKKTSLWILGAALIVIGLGLGFFFLSGPAFEPESGDVAVQREISPLEAAREQIRAGEVDRAESELRELAQKAGGPEQLAAMEELGTLLLKQGRAGEASAFFRSKLGRTSSESLYYKLALAEAVQGHDDEAIRTLDEGLRLYPKSKRLSEARLHLGGE